MNQCCIYVLFCDPTLKMCLAVCKEKEHFLRMGGFVVYQVTSGFIADLSRVISCHLILSQQSKAAGDEVRAEMRSNFNDPCGQIASLQQKQQQQQQQKQQLRGKNSILDFLQRIHRFNDVVFLLFHIQYSVC